MQKFFFKLITLFQFNGMDSTDPQNCSEQRQGLQEDKSERPHPKERITSCLNKINIVGDDDFQQIIECVNKCVL